MSEKRPAKNKPGEIPAIEWIIGALGALIVAAAISFLLVEAFTGDASPPDIRVEVKEIAAVQNGFRVRFEARNHGGEAAAQVVIEGTLRRGEKDLETSEATLTYLPAHSERGGGLFFQNDPRTADLQLHARSYEDP